MTVDAIDRSSFLPWRSAGFWAWLVVVMELTMAATAPVRPWGWTGSTALILGVVCAMLAWRVTPGLPSLRASPAVVAGGTLATAIGRALLHASP